MKKRAVISAVSACASAVIVTACANGDKFLTMIDKGEAIEIEVAEPTFSEDEQGTRGTLSWEELASLETNGTIRREWDNELLIVKTDEGKNGVLYVNVLGENENNNTLRQALHNREFLKQLDDKTMLMKLAVSVREQYADMDGNESDKKAVYGGINGYFNLLPDNEVNYANMDSVLTRAEFMSMVMRGETPVDESVVADEKFEAAVGQSEFNRYASKISSDSYLDIASKSLNNGTYNSTMTRGEAIYMLMHRYFNSELQSTDTKGATLSDCKNGGNISEKQQFAGKDYGLSYELTYALQNSEAGAPESIYKAIVLASEKGIISNETRWDEGITKGEAVELLVEALRRETGMEQFAYTQGKYESEKSNEYLAEQEQSNKGNEDDNKTDSVNSTGEGTILSEGDYREAVPDTAKDNSTKATNTNTNKSNDNGLSMTDAEIKELLNKYDNIVSEKTIKDLLRDGSTRESIEENLKEVYAEVEAGEVTVSNNNQGTANQAPATEDIQFSDPDFVFGQGDYSDASTTGHVY